MTKAGVYSGMMAVITTLRIINFGLKASPYGVFFGFWGLLVNLAICLLVTFLTSPPPKEALDHFCSA